MPLEISAINYSYMFKNPITKNFNYMWFLGSCLTDLEEDLQSADFWINECEKWNYKQFSEYFENYIIEKQIGESIQRMIRLTFLNLEEVEEEVYCLRYKIDNAEAETEFEIVIDENNWEKFEELIESLEENQES